MPKVSANDLSKEAFKLKGTPTSASLSKRPYRPQAKRYEIEPITNANKRLKELEDSKRFPQMCFQSCLVQRMQSRNRVARYSRKRNPKHQASTEESVPYNSRRTMQTEAEETQFERSGDLYSKGMAFDNSKQRVGAGDSLQIKLFDDVNRS